MIKILTVGPLEENTVLLIDDETKETVIIDPGAEGEKILTELKDLKPVCILATHGHLDHIGQVGFLKEQFNIHFYMNEKDSFLISNNIFPGFAEMLKAVPCPDPDFNLKEGDKISFGRQELTVIETPGHTPGGICFYSEKEKYLVAGDTLFRGSVGRTDLPGGDEKELLRSLKKLTELPDDTVVICGHGPNTTIGEEKRSNPYITGRYKINLW